MKKLKAAIFCAAGLGDGILYSVLAHNLWRNGYEVDLCNDYLLPLQSWFPHIRLAPLPAKTTWQKECLNYDLVILQTGFPSMSNNPLPQEEKFSHVHFLKNWEMDNKRSIIEGLLCFCQKLPLENVVKDTGLTPPSGLISRRHAKRVLLHPTSREPLKIWPAAKFLKVAKKLEDEGYEPVFIVAPNERKAWEGRVKNLPFFSSLNELASFIYESGYVIGNDSGIAHLGSALGLPTVTLHMRASRANFWKPPWTEGRVVTALPLAFGRTLRTKTWKLLTQPFQVLRQFRELQK